MFRTTQEVKPLLPAVMKCKFLLVTPISDKSSSSGSSTTPSTVCRHTHTHTQNEAAEPLQHEDHDMFFSFCIYALPRRPERFSWLFESSGPTLCRSYLCQNFRYRLAHNHSKKKKRKPPQKKSPKV